MGGPSGRPHRADSGLGHRRRARSWADGRRPSRHVRRHGNRQDVCSRLRRWALDGTWQRMLAALMARAGVGEDLEPVVPVDFDTTDPAFAAPGATAVFTGAVVEDLGRRTVEGLACDAYRVRVDRVLKGSASGDAGPPERPRSGTSTRAGFGLHGTVQECPNCHEHALLVEGAGTAAAPAAC